MTDGERDIQREQEADARDIAESTDELSGPEIEGDCSMCEGTGEVVHSECEGSGCDICYDGVVSCLSCQGTGYRTDENGDSISLSDMIPW
jgi:hypothetical protein